MVQTVGNWRITMFRAAAALAFGVLTLFWPGITLLVLVVMFGAFVLVDGVSDIVDVARNETRIHAHRGWQIFGGVLGVLAGLITFVWPEITALVLLFLIATWAILTGGVRLWAAIKVRHDLDHGWYSLMLAVILIAHGWHERGVQRAREVDIGSVRPVAT